MDPENSSASQINLFSNCPECDANIQFDSDLSVGLRVACPQCQTPLEIISEQPIRLDWAFVALEDVVKPPTN